jgi:carbonic anhydrase
MGKLTQLLTKIKPAISGEKDTNDNRTGSNERFVNNVTINNILLVMEQIKNQSAIIADLETRGNVKIVGGLYDVTTGEVTFY